MAVSAVRTVRISGTFATKSEDEGRTEMDSHADTCVVGDKSALIIHDFEQIVRVYGYNKEAGQATECRMVSAVVAYDHPETGDVYMLTIHQAVLVPKMRTNLLSTMQLRDNDVRVNDEPKHLALTPTEDHHAIVIGAYEQDGIEREELRIPMAMKGVVSYIPTRKPTRQEYESCDLDRCYELTAESPEWDPSTTRFEEQEAAMLDSSGNLKPRSREPVRIIASLHSMPQQGQAECDFGRALEATVQVRNRPTAKEKRTATLKSIKSAEKRPTITPQRLAKNWGIGIALAKKTLAATTQRGVRTVLHPTLSRRFRTNDRQLRYRRLACDMFTDTLEARTKSWFRQNRYAQVFATRFGWVRVFPMKAKSDAHEGLSLLAQRDGVPRVMVMDGSKEQTLGTFRKKAREMGMQIKQTEPYSPWQNAAEGAIKETKRGAGRKMMKAACPAKLWDRCLELEGYIRSNTALDINELEGQVPETILSGQTADISPYVEHGFYDWVKYYDVPAGFPQSKEVYGRWLGPAIDVGPAMTAKILKKNGHEIYTSTCRAITEDEWANSDQKKERDEFDQAIKERLGNPISMEDLEEIDPDAVTPEYELYDDDFEGTYENVPDVDDINVETVDDDDDDPKEATPEPTPEEADQYVGAEVNLPFEGTSRQGRVKKRVRDSEGNVTGTANKHAILDTRIYQVEFPDGGVAEYSANVIAENMVAMCDADGNQFLLLDQIIDHQFDDNVAMKIADQEYIHNGRKYLKKTTKGVKLCARWKNGSTSWIPLSDMKESYPVQVAEYAVSAGVDHEPAFNWWVPYTLKKRDRIIAAVNKRYHKRTHKFGFEIPKTVKRALEIDQENGNTLWRDAIAKEMKNVKVAFEPLEDGKDPPIGYQFMECHMVFDVKMEANFRRKARLVAGGHMVPDPAVLTYSSVVSRDTVRIALTMAALNDLEVKASDVQNAYLTAPCEEKIWTILGPEFGEDEGKKALIVRALYGLKSAGASYARHIADCMEHLGYRPCRADPDLWMKPMVRPGDNFEYYAYILLYVDDCLCIHHDAENALKELDHYFTMKKGSIGDPDIYLGGKLRKVTLENGVEAWCNSPSKYVQEAVSNVESYLAKNYGGQKLKKKVTAPWPHEYYSETDESPECDPAKANYYQSQVGVLHWIVELGRVDIVAEVSILASHMAMPREGHLEALFHVFAYLKWKHNSAMVFDPTYPEINHDEFTKQDWKQFYGDVKEPIPPNAPPPRGKSADLRLYVDSDHAGDKRTRRSRTGFFIYLNSALIFWLSKKQATVETSVFGAEFVALKHGIETIRGLRYKLRMMGVPVETPAYVYGDNMSVIRNTSRPESTLKKKSNQICYHFARESVAMGECLTTHIPTNENVADLATKIIGGGMKRNHLVSKLLHYIADYE